MPWHIGASDSCPSSKPHAVIKDSDGSVAGCHPTKEAADKQLAALYASESRALERERTMTDTSVSSIERRYTPMPVELRMQDDRKRIGGYAAKFNKLSRNLGGFVERVNPTFFNKSRADGWTGVMARYNHDNMYLLGTTDGGTLSLRVDATGLEYDIDPPSGRADIVELVSRGDVRNCSFAWRQDTTEDEWSLSDQKFPLRTLVSAQLVDIAPCNSGLGAYPDSTAGLRSLAERMNAPLEEVRALAEQNELQKFFVRTDGPTAPEKLSVVQARANAARYLVS